MLSILAGGSPTRGLQQTDLAVQRSLSRLSSGLRIVHSADDAAGNEIQENIGAKVRGAHQAAANIQDALSFLRIAEDGIAGVLGVLQNMRELTVRGGNGSLSTADRAAIDSDLQSLGLALWDAQGVAANARINYQAPPGQRQVIYQVGSDKGQTVMFDFNNLAVALGTFLTQVPTMTVATTAGADTARTQIDAALSGTVLELAKLGGFINTLEHSASNVSNMELMQAKAQSQIRDLDFAAEMVDFTRDQIKQQTGMTAVVIHNLRYGSLAKLIYAA
jgi:flagellin